MRALLVAVTLIYADCAAAAERKSALPVGAGPGIVYRMPSTSVALNADLVLRACTNTSILAEATVTIAATANADLRTAFRLNAQGLASALDKRTLTLELNENGTIKSLNSVSEDRTGAVVLGVFKAAAQIAGAFVGAAAPAAGGPTAKCNRATLDGLELAQTLRAALATQRDVLADPSKPAADAKKVAKLLETLALQLAALESGPLKLTLSTPLDLDKGVAGDVAIDWSMGDLRKWLAADPASAACAPMVATNIASGSGCTATTTAFAMRYRVEGQDAVASSRAIGDPCLYDRANGKLGCDKHIAMVVPGHAKVTVIAKGDDLGGTTAGAVLGSVRVVVPQWGAIDLIPLDVKTFRSRTLELTFDPFGRATKMSWTSSASAENATGTVAGIAEAALPLAKKLSGKTDLQVMQDEATLIEARIKLQALRACEIILVEGGTTCPAAASVTPK